MKKLTVLEKVGVCLAIYIILGLCFAMVFIAMETFGASQSTMRLIGGSLTYPFIGLAVLAFFNVQKIVDFFAGMWQRFKR